VGNGRLASVVSLTKRNILGYWANEEQFEMIRGFFSPHLLAGLA